MPRNLEMHAGADYRLPPAKTTRNDGIMRASDFDDVYFSVDNGLAEARHVFLAGNDLYDRMGCASHLTLAETGFGSGLNLLAVMQTMERHPALQIDFISLEGFPLDNDQLCFVHRQFPEIAVHAAALRAALPPRWPGHHIVPLMDGRLTLHLLYGAIESQLAQSDFRADAWFLDGFTPARNPDMWTPDVLHHIGRLTRQQGTCASFTAAASVRQGLAAAGFTITKMPGYGRKRDMIAGVKRGDRVDPVPGSKRIGIIGAGIAGAAVAAGLARRGTRAVVFDAARRPGTRGSGNRLALQTPRLAVDHNPASRMSAACLAFAAREADSLDASVFAPVASLDWPEREAVRHDKFRQQFWPSDLICTQSAEQVSDNIGVACDVAGMRYDFGRVVRPDVMISGLLRDSVLQLDSAVSALTRGKDNLIIETEQGQRWELDHVVFAAGANMAPLLALAGIEGIPCDITSGQVSQVPATDASRRLQMTLSYGGYLTPAFDGYHELGATFDRTGTCEISDAANQHNLDLLPRSIRLLVSDTDASSIRSRVGQRASTPDRNPVMGEIAPGLFVLGALGARGFTLAPLLGDMLAASILNRPVSIERDIRQLLDPFRFRMRASKR